MSAQRRTNHQIYNLKADINLFTLQICAPVRLMGREKKQTGKIATLVEENVKVLCFTFSKETSSLQATYNVEFKPEFAKFLVLNVQN